MSIFTHLQTTVLIAGIITAPAGMSADGKWTAVAGILEGTFTRPMPTPDGKLVQPTGRPYRPMMATVGRWSDGVMQEAWLFWDNHAFMKQIGLAE